MIFNAVGLVIGLAILFAGVFYLIREKNDKKSVKIYGTVIVIGGILFIAMLFKNIFMFLG